MLVTHDMLEKSTPVCIAFNHMPWHYLAVARLDQNLICLLIFAIHTPTIFPVH